MCLREKLDRRGREAFGDGVTSRSVEAFQCVIMVALKKGKHPREA